MDSDAWALLPYLMGYFFSVAVYAAVEHMWQKRKKRFKGF